MLRVLSLGAGVQSSTVLLMSCVGELPKLDAAVFADTGWEPRAVYEHLHRLENEAARAGIPVYRVSKGNIREDSLRATVRKTKAQAAAELGVLAGAAKEGPEALAETAELLKALSPRYANMPLYTKNPDGSIGAIRRQCTREYKVEPIEQFIRRGLLGLAPRRPAPTGSVELWMGISADEQRRIRISQDQWKTHRYPLVFDLPKAYRRQDCLAWLTEHGFPRAPRSACIGCPFHSDAEWRAIRADPEQWADVAEFDERIRHRGGMRGELFLHRSGLPLVQVDFSTPEERGQMAFSEECLGYCGV